MNFIQSDRTSYDVSLTSSKTLRFSNEYANSEDYIINFRKGCTELYTMPLFIFVKGCKLYVFKSCNLQNYPPLNPIQLVRWISLMKGYVDLICN